MLSKNSLVFSSFLLYFYEDCSSNKLTIDRIAVSQQAVG